MQLLREYKRAAGGTIGRRADRSRGRWTFEGVIDSLEEKLKAFGVEVPDSSGEAEGPLHRAPPGPPPRAGADHAPPPPDGRSPTPRKAGEDRV